MKKVIHQVLDLKKHFKVLFKKITVFVKFIKTIRTFLKKILN